MKKFQIGKRIILILITAPLMAHSGVMTDSNAKTEKEFNLELKRFNSFIREIFRSKIHISESWDSQKPTFSANGLTQSGPVISISGFDYRSNSLAAFRLGLCHEAGHYLGGAPYLTLSGNSIESTLNRMELSAEGQADYFAAYCLKRYMDYVKVNEMEVGPIASSVDRFCQNAMGSVASLDKFKCEYVATAALDLANYLVRLRQGIPVVLDDYKTTQPSMNTLVRRGEYPTINCRLKTYLVGILCDNTNSGLKSFVCESGLGARPDCWYQGE